MASKVSDTILISAAGNHGSDETQSWEDGSNHDSAGLGASGRHGRHAQHPKPGTRGREVRVRIKGCSPSGSVLVEREDHPSSPAKPVWSVSPAQDLLIDCRGGNGGRGGIGEDGQDGGEGLSGITATQWYDATAGGPGGHGGDAGRGTDGAMGGDGGHVYVTVREEDVDALLALRWNVDGGAGGAKGLHGQPGAGGRGGCGGSGCSWIETNGDGEVTTCGSRPGAPNGMNGYHGRAVNLPLSDGQSGTDGFCHIQLCRKGGAKAEMWSGRYELVVRSFDAIDENEDDIYEPGEFLIVENIVIQNVGRMPSPQINPLVIAIRRTSWLHPDVDCPIQLPLGIPPGATVRLSGSLGVLIGNEGRSRPSGVLFRAEDTVSLDVFSPRLKRRVPEFEGVRPVVYEYPVTTGQPKFLEAIAIGDRVKFSWQVNNKSSKPYGNAAKPRRQVRSRISNPDGTFNWMSKSDGKEESAPRGVTSSFEVLEKLEPNGGICVVQYLTVTASAEVFSLGTIKVQLFFADPHSDTDPSLGREVVHFSLEIQSILRLVDFIQQVLHLKTDILNLSLVGSLTFTGFGGQGQSSLLSRYKTIIIYASSFAYFQDGTRNPWVLIDPWEVSRLATAGTSFLFFYPHTADVDLKSLQRWARQVVLPAHEFSPMLLRDTLVEKPSEILRQLEECRPRAAAPVGEQRALPTLAVKKDIFRSLHSKAASKAKSVQQILAEQQPLRRFVVSPDEDPSVPNSIFVTMSEGLPHKAQIVILNPPKDPDTPADGSVLTAMVVLTIPYTDQCRIFWNMVISGPTRGTGMSVRAAYGGDGLEHLRGRGRPSTDEKIVDHKALELIAWPVTKQITSEISRFCHKAPWRDRLNKTYLLSQLPLLVTFFDTSPPPSYSSLSKESLQILNAVLAPALGVSAPISLGNWLRQNVLRIRNRKHKAHKTFHHVLDQLFDTLCAYGPYDHKILTKAKATAKKMLSEEEAAAKKALKSIKKENSACTAVDRARELCHRRLEEIVGVPRGSSDFIDLGDLAGVEKRSVYMSRDELNEERYQHEDHLAKMKSDATLSGKMLADMLTWGVY
ncbi:hypothetical protein QBC37DRAFT_389844 [Rhypophila decipiens]|uniref:DUF7932 domain-containing protein n=1 Tax=Rhypophila decipiens TaxID=261697 RepID=A0AAN7B5W4_9PEZI|nr:hypothetical protein QBC37DRAFT_389844 [Rhypophila decipiens]